MTRNELKELWFSVPKQNKIECKVVIVNAKSNEVKIISDVNNYISTLNYSNINKNNIK